MNSEITLKEFLSEILEPIIDESIQRAMHKFINEINYDSDTTSDILTLPEAASYLKLSKQTLYAMTSKRVLPHSKQGKRIYFRRSELDQWINSGKVKTQEEIETEASDYLIRKRR